LPQGDLHLANQSGAAFRAELNNQLLALASNQSGTTDPTTTEECMFYADTGDDTLKIRNKANNAFINVSAVGGLETVNFGLATVASPTFTGDVVINSTTALRVPVGTDAQRNAYTASNGDIRYNTTSSTFEGYAGGAWGAIGGGATGAGGDAVFYENSLTVTTSYSITANSGAHCVGPLVINSGQTVTVPSSSHLVIS
tara:strand:- start:320 stop:913 length:594 start_codon:yes stop_codon:yes gene_type:complete